MNIHRGSDFNQFLIEEGIMTPTPTPRTDAIAHRGLGSVAYIAEMTEFARQLERENQTFRAAQKACEDCDAPRVDRIAELERELADAREWSSRLADVADELRAELAELTEWREMIDREVGTLREELAAERELADRLAGELVGIAWLQSAIVPNPAELAMVAWKEARRGTV